MRESDDVDDDDSGNGDRILTFKHVIRLESMKRRRTHRRKSYQEAIGEDIEVFISSVRSWAASVIGAEAAEGLALQSGKRFANPRNNARKLNSSFQESNITACLDKTTLHRMAGVLESLLTTPNASDDIQKAVHSLEWRPSLACMSNHQVKYLGGGSGAGFTVQCGSHPSVALLDASCGGGGGGRNPNGTYWYRGGSQVHVRIPHYGNISIHGNGRRWKLDELEVSVGLDTIATLKDAMRSCASNQSLWIQGGGGGGWESFSLQEGTGKVRDAFGFYFVLAHPDLVDGEKKKRPSEHGVGAARAVNSATSKHMTTAASTVFPLSTEVYERCLPLPDGSGAAYFGACWEAQAIRDRDGVPWWLLQKAVMVQNDLFSVVRDDIQVLGLLVLTVIIMIVGSTSLRTATRRRGYRTILDR